MKKITIHLEYNKDGDLWGMIKGIGHFSPYTVGDDKESIKAEIIDLIDDYMEHEGKDDPEWSAIDIRKAKVEYVYDLSAVFQVFDFLNISKVAERAGMNASLLRQYVAGIKYPKEEQAKRIETAIRDIAKELSDVVISPAVAAAQ